MKRRLAIIRSGKVSDARGHDSAEGLAGVRRGRSPQFLHGAGNLSISSQFGERGSPLPRKQREQFEHRTGGDLEAVRLHTSDRADQAARRLKARAFTYGNDIVFRRGQLAPGSESGRKLLAHELTHVRQQQRSGQPRVQRQEDTSADSESRATDFRRIRMRFDGEQLVVYGDGGELFSYSASSGRPIQVTEEHANECGGDARVDTYMSPRFRGIKNNGPIPEGTFRFSPPRIREFSTGEQLNLLVSGVFGADRVNLDGGSVHSGDWGAGRVALRKVRVSNAPCGNTQNRGSFFLHGGLLAGSSGCIDIGTNFDELAEFLRGYRRPIVVEVQYTTDTPRVGFFTGLGGALAYQGFGLRHGPALRLGAEFGLEDPQFVVSAEYQAVLDWAGGAMTAGVHLDVPMNSESAFIRAGLRGGVEFRLLHALYGNLSAGGFIESSHGGSSGGSGYQIGGGLSYDFGEAELSVLHNHLQGVAAGGRHQALLGLGFRW